MRRPRVFLAGLFHETHTFLDGTTPWSEFMVLRGDEILAVKGESSPLGGALDAAEQLGWDIFPSISAGAYPSAIGEDDVFHRYWAEFESALSECEKQGPLDAVFLVLHGAMTCESISDVEGTLLERLQKRLSEVDARQKLRAESSDRPAMSRIPVFGVYDLHANFTQRMANGADCLVAYRENPHADARESAVRAVHHLHRTLQTGQIPRQIMAQPPIMWPPTGTGTSTDPMKSLSALARTLEANHSAIVEVSVTAGFSFADTYDTGVSFVVSTTGEEAEAREALQQLCNVAFEMAEIGNVVEAPVDDVLAELPRDQPGLMVIVEPSDNIGGGGPGDCTGLLRAFIRHGFRNSAVCICDADAVKKLKTHRAGDFVTLAIGGRGSRLDPGPLELNVELVRLSNGLFELVDKQSHLASMVGDRFDMGDCAVVRHEGVTILLTTVRTPPMDLGQWRHVGEEPSKFSFVGVKAAVAHRKAWDPISNGNVWVSTPGPCSSDLTKLPYRKLRRPIFPLDAISGQILNQ